MLQGRPADEVNRSTALEFENIAIAVSVVAALLFAFAPLVGLRRRSLPIASGRLLLELLYEVRPSDPLVLSSVAALLTLVSLLSGWLPARRAAMIDPRVALREE